MSGRRRRAHLVLYRRGDLRGVRVDVAITDDRIEIRRRWPAWLSNGIGLGAAIRIEADDVEVIELDSRRRRAMTIATRSGVAAEHFLRPFGSSDRAAPHAELVRHGYPVR